VALHYIGKDAYSNDPADYKAAAEMLAKVRKDVRLFSSTMIDDIAGGKACVAIGWSGDINIAAGRAKENKSKDEIEALLPSTGALIFFDTMAITKDAKHPNNAMAFIDFYLRAENAALMANEMNYPTGNKAAMDKIKPEIAGNKTIFVEADYFAKMIAPAALPMKPAKPWPTPTTLSKKANNPLAEESKAVCTGCTNSLFFFVNDAAQA
jgi:putrescine transport system substrate-binding protein